MRTTIVIVIAVVIVVVALIYCINGVYSNVDGVSETNPKISESNKSDMIAQSAIAGRIDNSNTSKENVNGMAKSSGRSGGEYVNNKTISGEAVVKTGYAFKQVNRLGSNQDASGTGLNSVFGSVSTKKQVMKFLGDFFQRERISEQDIVKITGLITEELLLERQLRNIDDDASYQAIDHAREKLKGALMEVCGSDKASEIILLKESAPYRYAIVNDYANLCAANGVPIDQKTQDNITILMYVNKVSLPDPTYTPVNRETYDLLTKNDPSFLTKTSGSLNQGQTNLLKDFLAQRFKRSGTP